jgi:hypothetical protein
VIPAQFECWYCTDDADDEDRRDEPAPDCSCDPCFYGRRDAWLAGYTAGLAAQNQARPPATHGKEHPNRGAG